MIFCFLPALNEEDYMWDFREQYIFGSVILKAKREQVLNLDEACMSKIYESYLRFVATQERTKG